MGFLVVLWWGRLQHQEVTSGQVIDYSVRGCGFRVHQLLPSNVFPLESLVSLPTGEGTNVGIRLPPAPRGNYSTHEHMHADRKHWNARILAL